MNKKRNSLDLKTEILKSIEPLLQFDMECFSTIDFIYKKLRHTNKLSNLAFFFEGFIEDEIKSISKGEINRNNIFKVKR